MEEQFSDTEQNPKGEKTPFAVAVIGNNAVAKAMTYVFGKNDNFVVHADGINHNMDDVFDLSPNIAVICTETKYTEDGLIEAIELEEQVVQILGKTQCGIIIRTPLPIPIVDRICRNARVVYAPILPSSNTMPEEHLSPAITILGGRYESTMAVQEVFFKFSKMLLGQVYHVSPVEACFIESSIASLSVIQRTFFNQLHDAVKDYGGDYEIISRYISSDPRVGVGHTLIPNLDQSRGEHNPRYVDGFNRLRTFGGENTFMTLLNSVNEINTNYTERK